MFLNAACSLETLKPCTLRGPGLGMDVDVFDDEGKPVAAGTPQEVLTAERLRAVYEVELTALPLSQSPHQWLVPRCGTGAN